MFLRSVLLAIELAGEAFNLCEEPVSVFVGPAAFFLSPLAFLRQGLFCCLSGPSLSGYHDVAPYTAARGCYGRVGYYVFQQRWVDESSERRGVASCGGGEFCGTPVSGKVPYCPGDRQRCQCRRYWQSGNFPEVLKC